MNEWPLNEQDEFIPTRRSLLERLRQWDDQQSWQEFFDTYWKLIYRAALRAGLTPAEAEDCVQETVICVARQMPSFEYKPSTEGGSFKSWLLRLTKWRIMDQLRLRLNSAKIGMEGEENDESKGRLGIANLIGSQVDSLWDTEWEQNLRDAAVASVKRRTDPKKYQVFYLYVVEGWSPWKVAQTLNVSLPQVYTIKHRVAKQLKATFEELRKRGGYDEEEHER